MVIFAGLRGFNISFSNAATFFQRVNAVFIYKICVIKENWKNFSLLDLAEEIFLLRFSRDLNDLINGNLISETLVEDYI